MGALVAAEAIQNVLDDAYVVVVQQIDDTGTA